METTNLCWALEYASLMRAYGQDLRVHVVRLGVYLVR